MLHRYLFRYRNLLCRTIFLAVLPTFSLTGCQSISRSWNAIFNPTPQIDFSSRGIAGIRGGTLIINLPGSPKGVSESLETILSVLPHAMEMIHGGGH